MNTQTNTYPEFSDQPLVTERNEPQLGNAYNPNNNQYVPPPMYPQGNTLK